MNPDLEAMWVRISATVDEGAALAKHVYDGMKADIRDLVELGESKLRNLIDKAVENETIRQMARAFFANVQKGKAAAVEALRREHSRCERQLEEMAGDKPEIVGFWDGFVYIFLALPANRRPGSRIYITHVKYGKVVGVVSAVLLFLPAGGVRAVLGALPVLVRGAQYLQEKVMAAKDRVRQSRPPAGSGRPAAETEGSATKRAKKASKPRKRPVAAKRGISR
jgi:hypothetical protein